MSRQVPPEIVAAAQATAAKWKIPASPRIAQWILESGWGERMPPGSNNPFGIKARAGEPSVPALTREDDANGRSTQIRAPFRKFASIEEAFDLHARLLATSPVYARARAKLPDVDAFVDQLEPVYDPRTGKVLKPGYATGSGYAKQLKAIIRGGRLTRFDTPAGVRS